jgi:hypothetical protein
MVSTLFGIEQNPSPRMGMLEQDGWGAGQIGQKDPGSMLT